MRRLIPVVIATAFFLTVAGLWLADLTLAGSSSYHLVKTLPIGGAGRWDYDLVDSAARRVYVSHQTHVVVLDADS